MQPIQLLAWAVSALSSTARNARYRLAVDYYDGNHRLAFATEKFRTAFGRMFSELAINHCSVVVDVISDRLQLESEQPFQMDAGEAAQQGRATEIWRRNRMDKRAGEVHQEAVKTGDSFVIVDWPDDGQGGKLATLYPNAAGRCAIYYDEENPGYAKYATRWWVEQVGGKWVVHINVYARDMIYKFATAPRDNAEFINEFKLFKPLDDDAVIPNPYGKVPVFHFANNAPLGEYGRSEVLPLVAPSDGLNKSTCDAFVGAEFAVLGQRYAIGFELEEENGRVIPPFRDGLANLWVTPPQRDNDGNVLDSDKAQPISFGEFEKADIAQLLDLKASCRQDISVISGVPAHYFMDAKGGWPSGEAQRTATARLRSKTRDRQIAFGGVWEDVMRLCLEIEGAPVARAVAQWVPNEDEISETNAEPQGETK